MAEFLARPQRGVHTRKCKKDEAGDRTAAQHMQAARVPAAGRSKGGSNGHFHGNGNGGGSHASSYKDLDTEVAVRFATAAEVDRAIDLIFENPELKNISWNSPDGYELRVPARAALIFKKSGLKYAERSLLPQP